MYRDLVYRPGVDSNTVETLPYDPSTEEKAQLLLDIFIGDLTGGPVAGLPERMSQEDFRDRVERRIDARGPSIQERLRQLGASSFQDAINKGIFPGAPRLPGV